MYRQIDGIAMGSPLGSTLAKKFVGYHETQLFANVMKPCTYFRYVDDIFAYFPNECERFFVLLNHLHYSLAFTVDKEINDSLPFLDVLVQRTNSEFHLFVAEIHSMDITSLCSLSAHRN